MRLTLQFNFVAHLWYWFCYQCRPIVTLRVLDKKSRHLSIFPPFGTRGKFTEGGAVHRGIIACQYIILNGWQLWGKFNRLLLVCPPNDQQLISNLSPGEWVGKWVGEEKCRFATHSPPSLVVWRAEIDFMKDNQNIPRERAGHWTCIIDWWQTEEEKNLKMQLDGVAAVIELNYIG